MAENLSYREIQNRIRDKFKGKKQAMKELGIKLNASKNVLIDVLNTFQNRTITTQYTRLQNRATELGYTGRKRASKQTLRNFIAEQENQIVRRYEEEQKRAQELAQEQKRQLRIQRLKLNLDANSFNKLQKMDVRLTDNELERLLTNLGNDRYLLHIYFSDGTTSIVTLREYDFESIMSQTYIAGPDNEFKSDAWEENKAKKIVRFKLEKVENKRMTNVRKNNAFFAYVNNTNIDLSNYQIYTSDQERNNQSCLIYVLEHHSIPKDVINNVLLQIGVGHINTPISKMKSIAELIDKKLVCHFYDENKQRNDMVKWGKKDAEELHFAQYKNHFFVFEEVQYTRLYLDNYVVIEEKFQDHPSKNLVTRITSKNIYSNNPKTINSLQLVVKMMELNMFSPLDIYNVKIDEVKIIPTIANIESDCKLVVPTSNIEESKKLIMYADCESDVNDKYHTPILFGVICNGEYKFNIRKNDLPTKDENDRAFASEIKRSILSFVYKNKIQIGTKIIVYFHNLKYDSSLFKHFYEYAECVKDGQVYSKTYKMNHYTVEFRDSYKHISKPLIEFTDMFKLGVSKKEAIAYRYYTIENINKKKVSIKKYSEFLREEAQKIFLENVYDFLTDEKTFDPQAYYLYYLKHDVEVLSQGMEKYAELMKKVSNLDIHDYLTVSSLGYNFALNQGAFNDCSYVSKGTREYIQEAIKGGRVYANLEYVKKEINEDIEDFDGVSLYPSAMKRLCDEYGLPMGSPKSSKSTDYSFYQSQDYYIVRIKINSINKKQMIPLVSHKVDDSIKYINEINNPLECTVDRITLEDYIRFQDITFEIVDGIYWNEGFNKKLGQVILDLHNERCLHKKSNKPLDGVIKLIMNSIYGKTGQRISEEKTYYIKHDVSEQYIYDHFALIKSVEKTEFFSKITKRYADCGYNLNYVAVMVLSMSKRIMNEVFDVMNTNNLPVFYTDTDSIHMLKKDVEPLGEAYAKQYNRELIGKNLGQFHTDFSMEGCEDVYSTKFIALGSKCYMDVLTGICETTGKEKQDTHIRMKGINKIAFETEVQNRMKSKGLNKIDATIDIYNYLAKGNPIEFVLNPTEFDASFEFGFEGVASRKVGSFKRVLSF